MWETLLFSKTESHCKKSVALQILYPLIIFLCTTELSTLTCYHSYCMLRNWFLKKGHHFFLAYKSVWLLWAWLPYQKYFFRTHVDYGDIIYDQAFNNSFHQEVESLQYNTALAITGAIRGTLRGKKIIKN